MGESEFNRDRRIALANLRVDADAVKAAQEGDLVDVGLRITQSQDLRVKVDDAVRQRSIAGTLRCGTPFLRRHAAKEGLLSLPIRASEEPAGRRSAFISFDAVDVGPETELRDQLAIRE